MLLSFVFSFRNEEENIPELVQRISKVVHSLEKVTYEMIFVNDDSTDQSLDLLMRLKKEYPIRIVNMSRRFGVTPCALAGFSQAKGDAIVYMDTDLQDPPEIVPKMVEKFLDGADIVHTTRLRRAGENPLKMWITAVAYRMINRLSGENLPVDTGDFKLLSKNVVQKILGWNEYDPYFRGLVAWVGYRQDFVYYNRESRFKGKTKRSLFSGAPAEEFIRAVTSFSSLPLYFSFYLGLATSAVSLLIILYAIVTKIFGLAATGVSGVLIAVAFFNGVILMTIGILGLYVSRIYHEVKGRPQYIIKNIVEPEESGV